MGTELTATRGESGAWVFDSRDAAIVAAAIPHKPPREWFEERRKTRLTITDEGQVYGMLADRTVPHIGLPGQPIYAPYSKTDYHWYHSGQTRCADGSVLATGRITLNGTHASGDGSITADAARDHYEKTGLAIADVVAWDEPEGVFCAGAARPGVTAEQIREVMGSIPSGDWRVIDGNHEMVATLLVNTPGFPPRIGIDDNNEMLSLVAAGTPQPVTFAKAPKHEENPVEIKKGDLVELVASGTLAQVTDRTDDGYAVELLVAGDDIKPASQEKAMAASAAQQTRAQLRSLTATVEQLQAEVAAQRRIEAARELVADLPEV